MNKKKNKRNTWMAIGAVFLILLLLIWLTYADLLGDTDVAAWLGGTRGGCAFVFAECAVSYFTTRRSLMRAFLPVRLRR